MSDQTSDTEQTRPTGLVGVVPAARMWRKCAPRQSRFRWLVLREHDAPPVSVPNPIETPDRERVGLCCSGGGVRSASFNLGALQAVQAEKRLQQIRYISAVSGGAYIASAFAMVAKTKDGSSDYDHPGGESDPALITPDAPPFHPGSPEEQYLRNRASYLAPTGLDKAFLIWRVLLGLLINLLLIASAVTIFAAVLSLYYRSADPGLLRPPHQPVGASPNGWVWGAGLSLSAIGLVMGGASLLLRPRHVPGLRGWLAFWARPGWRRFLEVWSLPIFLLGLVIFALEVVVPQVIDVMRGDDTEAKVQATNEVGAGVSATVAAIVGAIIIQLRAQVADPGKAIKDAKSRLAQLPPRIRLTVIYIATAVLGPALIFAVLVAATMAQVEADDTATRIAIPAAAILVIALFSRLADLNSWSLNPFYRRRLATAFALRRIRSPGDPETGHAEARHERDLVPLSQTKVLPDTPPWDKQDWPTLIVCAAANVSDPGAAPAGRSVTTFTFSDDELGGPLVGGIETDVYEGILSPSRQRDFTLPAVVAMSGAAISPSMGKATRSSVRFLMGMANVRLGVWVPNPRRIESFVRLRSTLGGQVTGVGKRTKAIIAPTKLSDVEREKAVGTADRKTRWMPRPTLRYLLKEMLGWNSINDKFLYVTDGGHYENLGLVELLRRGCGRIYCFDASGGQPLAALGDAIALARSELGVEITFPDEELAGLREDPDTKLAAARCAVGTVRYTRSTPEVTGTLVYAPTVMTAELPWDVHAFKARDGAFPRHSTLDQLFTDQKFEAYRVLGQYAGISAMNRMDEVVGAPPVTVSQAAPVTPHNDGSGLVDALVDWAYHRRHPEHS